MQSSAMRLSVTPTCAISAVSVRARLGNATPLAPALRRSLVGTGRLALQPRKPKGLTGVPSRGDSIVRASLLGVGAPEALLVGVVALVLFGPKGLAQAAKSLGETLRAFAPTIRELTQVSSELKSSLEEEIGLNDLREEFSRPMTPQPRPAKPFFDESPIEATMSTSDDNNASMSKPLSELTANMQRADDAMAAAADPDIEKKREEAARMAWGAPAPAAAPAAETVSRDLGGMSVEELEAELARRKSGAA